MDWLKSRLIDRLTLFSTVSQLDRLIDHNSTVVGELVLVSDHYSTIIEYSTRSDVVTSMR